MDAVHRCSGTGVFYQAMPAVGADGKNIMKLIPVQMVNGQFVQTLINNPKTDPKPLKPVAINTASAPLPMVKIAAVKPSATQQVDNKQVSLKNALPNQVGLDLCNALNKQPQLQQTVNLMAKVPQMATLSTNCEKSVRLKSELPVTVKSPALPKGHYLQIPPNAQVRTVPASELPPSIKKQIFTSSACSSPGSGLRNVVYVSPITTVNQGITPPSDAALQSLKLVSMTSNKTSCGRPSKQPHLKLIPKVSQRPNSPTKWTIEEEDSSTTPTLDPLNSASVTSEILWALAERENASKPCDVMTKPFSQLSQAKKEQEQDNALVMCNGKVFFVAKKCSLPPKIGKTTSKTKHLELPKTTVPSSQQSLESVAPEIRQDLRIIIPDESDDVIDLCDDDAQDDPSQQAATVNMSAVTHLDEDNVIFVSYIPPKSEAGSAQDLVLKTQMALVKEKDQKGTSSSTVRGRNIAQNMLVSTEKNLTPVCGSAGMNMHDNKGSNIKIQQSTSMQQLDSLEADGETEGPADPSTSDSSREICSQTVNDTHKMESSVSPTTSCTSSLSPKSHQMSDHLLRQTFGITADVKICLQRIDEASAWSVPAEPLQSEPRGSVEDIQEPTSVLKKKQFCVQELYSPQEADSKLVKVLTEQELSPDPATSPLKCSHFKLNTTTLSAMKCNLGQSSLKGTSCDVETEPVIGYVEPIDEDFLRTDENDIPNSENTDVQPQTPTCAVLNANTRRMGRARKRTMCPCCIPGTPDSAAKYSVKSAEPEKWTWTTDQRSRKGGRTKAVRKGVNTSVKISCLTAKNKQSCKTYGVPVSESLDTMFTDSEEIKRQEEIKRLKELLREKEAALDLMRNSMS